MISMQIYKQGNDLLIGACDEHLLGKTFSEGKFHLSVEKKFYDGERVETKVLKRFLKDATIANLVGEETIKCAVGMGLVSEDCILRIDGVPHAQMVRMI
ncbi:MAG: DUF424 family protein [Candidatus Thermoplasmatota archaeon]|nr:DUF424 family protein [Candidatus Thermoplasmatota archaeon]